jgi:hypothetical protein
MTQGHPHQQSHPHKNHTDNHIAQHRLHIDIYNLVRYTIHQLHYTSHQLHYMSHQLHLMAQHTIQNQ